jgi:prophage endopeptidase
MNTPFSFRTMAIGLLLVALIVAGRLAFYFHGNAVRAGEQVKQLQSNNNLQAATITDMLVRRRDVGLLDEKYTKELANAKANIDQLQRDVIAGKRRLQLNARCPANGATSTGGMGDGSSPGLVDSAERDYFTLRERIVTVTKQVGFLQDYIKEQCLK